MSIWKDLANFGVGAIERDRELTNEKLTIRAEELKANRDLMIAMKKDKYAADIAEYKKEKAKANEIKKLNSVAASGNMDSISYAKQYLLHNLGTEKFNALQKAFKKAKKKDQRQHVTPYIYQNKNKFKILNIKLKKNYSKYRFTVDYPEDLNLLKKIISKSKLGRNITYIDAIKIIKKYPEIKKINEKFTNIFFIK